MTASDRRDEASEFCLIVIGDKRRVLDQVLEGITIYLSPCSLFLYETDPEEAWICIVPSLEHAEGFLIIADSEDKAEASGLLWNDKLVLIVDRLPAEVVSLIAVIEDVTGISCLDLCAQLLFQRSAPDNAVAVRVQCSRLDLGEVNAPA